MPRRETFVLQWNNLQNATEYAISLYSQDTKGVATEQNVTSTTFFIETDIVRCEGEDGWPTTAAGENALMSCELGFSGNYVRTCGYDAHWSAIRNECGTSWIVTMILSTQYVSCFRCMESDTVSHRTIIALWCWIHWYDESFL